MAEEVDKCLPILDGGLLTRKEADKLRSQIEQWNDKKLAYTKEHIDSFIKAHIEDGIEIRYKQVSDMVKVEDLVMQYRKDPFSGKTLTKASEVVKNRLNQLVGRNSVDSRRRALTQHIKLAIDEYERIFNTSQNAQYKTLRDIPKGSDAEKQLYMRVHDMVDKPDLANLTPDRVKSLMNGTDDIGRLALALTHYNEYARQLSGQYGVSVRYNKNYVMKRRYDWDSMNALGKEEFSRKLVGYLDLEAMKITPESAFKEAGDFFDRIKKESSDKSDFTSNKEYIGAPAESMSRKFIFKNSEAAYGAFNDFSMGGMREQFERNASNMAATNMSISEFGYEAKKVLAQVSSRLNDLVEDDRGALTQWRESRIVMAQEDIAGTTNLVQGSFTNFVNNARFIQAAAKLGNAVTGTILDVVDNQRQIFYVNGSLFGGAADFAKNMTKVTAGMNQEQRVALAQELGLALNHISFAESMRLADGNLGGRGGMITKWIQEHGNTVMNLATLLPAQTSRSKLASALTGANAFTKLVNAFNTGTKLNKFELDTLKEYGFTDAEMRLLGSSMVEKSQTWSDPLVTTSGIKQSLLKGESEAHIKKVAEALGVDPREAGNAILKLAKKHEAFVNDFITRGTPQPELATKTIMFKNINNETVRGIAGLLTQFLDTPMAQLGHVAELGRKLNRINDSKLGVAKDTLAHTASYMTVAIPAYLGADLAMSLAMNRESLIDKLNNGDDDTRRKAWTNIIGRSGIAPFMFEVLDAQFGGGYNKTALDTFGSPTMSTFNDVLRLAQDNDENGLSFKEFAFRQGPTNSLIPRALNNWSDAAFGDKIWETREATRFN